MCDKKAALYTKVEFPGGQKLTEYDLQMENGVYVPDSTVKQETDLHVYYRPKAQLSKNCNLATDPVDFLVKVWDMNELAVSITMTEEGEIIYITMEYTIHVITTAVIWILICLLAYVVLIPCAICLVQ